MLLEKKKKILYVLLYCGGLFFVLFLSYHLCLFICPFLEDVKILNFCQTIFKYSIVIIAIIFQNLIFILGKFEI